MQIKPIHLWGMWDVHKLWKWQAHSGLFSSVGGEQLLTFWFKSYWRERYMTLSAKINHLDYFFKNKIIIDGASVADNSNTLIFKTALPFQSCTHLNTINTQDSIVWSIRDLSIARQPQSHTTLTCCVKWYFVCVLPTQKSYTLTCYEHSSISDARTAYWTLNLCIVNSMFMLSSQGSQRGSQM